MSEKNDATVYFLPWTRLGLATTIKQELDEKNPPIDPQNKSLRVPIGGLRLNIEGRDLQDGEMKKLELNEPLIYLYGPGDLLGFDPRIVARTIPPPHTGNFGNWFFPGIEFTNADFAWRYTPGKWDETTGNVIPWITLIVLVTESWNENVVREFEDIPNEQEALPKRIKVSKISSLPDLRYAKFWAHVQIVGKSGLDCQHVLEETPAQAICRLLCPRHLCPKTKYTAFVVPTFYSGRLAGLGRIDSKPVTQLYSWEKNEENIELPYYYRWEFITSASAQFEDLVRLLRKQKLTGIGLKNMDCSSPGYGVGKVQRSNVEEPEKHYLGSEGALVSADTHFTPWGTNINYTVDQQGEIRDLEFHYQPFARILEISFKTDDEIRMYFGCRGADGRPGQIVEEWIESRDHHFSKFGLMPRLPYQFVIGEKNGDMVPGTFMLPKAVGGMTPTTGTFWIPTPDSFQSKLAYLINLPDLEKQRSTADVSIPVVPPIYGRYHYGKTKKIGTNKVVVSEIWQTCWIDILNLDPRHRFAASLGAQIVRKNQEAMMASAWEQLGALKSINDLINTAQNGIEASHRLHKRIRDLNEEDRLFLTRPLHQKINSKRINPNENEESTLANYLKDTVRVPKGAVDAALRRINRPGGTIRKRQKVNLIQVNPLRYKKLVQPSNGVKILSGPVNNNIKAETNITEFSGGLLNRYAALDSRLRLTSLKLTGSEELVKSCDNLPGILPTDETAAEDGIIKTIATGLQDYLDPRRTVVNRLKARIQLPTSITAKYLNIEESPQKNNVRRVLFAPQFPQPMIKELEKISRGLIVPGIEKIDPNTMGLLKINPRFIEAFLCGCNHEFACELQWREYPTDQRGTYFRQFWDASMRFPDPNKINELFNEWLNQREDGCREVGCIGDVEKVDKLRQYLSKDQLKDYIDENGQILDQKLVNEKFEQIVKQELWDENIKDIKPMTAWDEQALGKNTVIEKEQLVLVIRGELLKQYPNASIYAVDAQENGNPKHPQWGYDSTEYAPQTPSFGFFFPPDMTFLAFPFTEDEARRSGSNPGKFFIIEEPVGESGFGLDETSDESDPADYYWEDFAEIKKDNNGNVVDHHYGCYADPILDDKDAWFTSTSAFRAKKCIQTPFRMAIHADQLLP